MKTRRGWLMKRGKTYHAAWKVSGKLFTKTTGETDKGKAKTRLAEIMQPFLVEDEVRTLETVRARIEGAKAELAVLDERQNPPLTIRQGWSAYMAAPTDARRPRQRRPGHRPATSPATLEKQAFKFSRFLNWIEKAYPAVKFMRDVTDAIAEQYETDLEGANMANATFNAHLGLLQVVWTVLAKRAKMANNPWTATGRKGTESEGRRELTIEELRAVCGKAEGEMRTLFAVGLYSGLRLGDCATLRWAEADIERGIIRRIPAKTARRKRKPVQVPMHATLKAVLAEARESGDGSEYVLPVTAALYDRDSSAVCKRVQDHFAACGIRTAKPGTGFKTETDADGKEKEVHTGKRAVVEVGFHSLRHSFVSLCRSANVPLAVVEALVSHASPAVTRLYTHTGEAAAASAVNGLPAVLGDAPAALPPARMIETERVRALADKLNGKNWKEVKSELNMMIAAD